MSACYSCGTSVDLRPYGPRGAMTCFKCAMSSPEKRRSAEQMFAAQLNACGDIAVIDGSGAGPYPAEHHPQLKKLIGANQ